MLTVTAADFANLSLIESPALARLLERAKVAPFDGFPPDIVTMYSRVLCIDVQTGERRVLRLVYPTDKPKDEGDVSVVAPAGLALLGRHAGCEIQWHGEQGKVCRLKVEAILYQPEQDLRTNLISV